MIEFKQLTVEEGLANDFWIGHNGTVHVAAESRGRHGRHFLKVTKKSDGRYWTKRGALHFATATFIHGKISTVVFNLYWPAREQA
jgi:hypothetical protein